MKKFFSFCVALCLGFMAVMQIFVMHKSDVAKAESIDFIENKINNKIELLSTDRNNIAQASASLNNSPLNTDTNEMMSGYTIHPNTNTYGEQRVTFSINPFMTQQNQSVYIWIYVADLIIYDLNIHLYNSSNEYIYWKFNSGEFSNLADNNGKKYVPYGWKLFELQLKDAETSDSLYLVYGETFSKMVFSYESPSSTKETISQEGLSFYHVFAGQSYQNTGVIHYQAFSNFQVKDEFASTLEGFYVNDDLKINGVYDVYDYVIVGKYDLKNYQNMENYKWSIVLMDSDNKKIEIDFGEVYTFEKLGWYSVNIKLTKVDTDEVVVNTSYSLHCDEFGMGSFEKKNHFFEIEKKEVIMFNINENFVQTSKLLIYTDDKNIVRVVDYRIVKNVCYIEVCGEQEGFTQLTITADGHREGFEGDETFTCKTTVYINKSAENSVPSWVAWVILGGFSAFMLTFVIISFVKARKFGVK